MNRLVAVRIAVIHNPNAGGRVSIAQLRAAATSAGHDIVRVVDRDVPDDLDTIADVLAVAGGDGTIARAAFDVADRKSRVPIAVIPAGTANNIALSLGVDGSLRSIVDRWSRATPIAVDLGTTRGDWGERRFIESVGGGAVCAGIMKVEGTTRPAGEPHAEVLHAIRRFREILPRIEPQIIKLVAGSQTRELELILLEVMSMRSIGPNLVLAPHADHGDGVFDVVHAGVEHRADLDRYLQSLLVDEPIDLELPTLRASHVEITGWRDVHIDDEVHDDQSIGHIAVDVFPAAVRFLA